MQLTISKVYPSYAVGHPPYRNAIADITGEYVRKMEAKRLEKQIHEAREKHRKSLQGEDWLL